MIKAWRSQEWGVHAASSLLQFSIDREAPKTTVMRHTRPVLPCVHSIDGFVSWQSRLTRFIAPPSWSAEKAPSDQDHCAVHHPSSIRAYIERSHRSPRHCSQPDHDWFVTLYVHISVTRTDIQTLDNILESSFRTALRYRTFSPTPRARCHSAPRSIHSSSMTNLWGCIASPGWSAEKPLKDQDYCITYTFVWFVRYSEVPQRARESSRTALTNQLANTESSEIFQLRVLRSHHLDDCNVWYFELVVGDGKSV